MSETEQELATRILKHVNSSKYHPVKPRVIAKKLGIDRDSLPQLKSTIKSLVRQGKLRFGVKHLVMPATASQHEVVGVFHRTVGGYGFVRPDGKKRPASREDDIFVPADRSGDAATGDRVSVAIRRRKRGFETRISGEIIEVLTRRTHNFVGTYFEQDNAGFVQVDGNLFPQAVYVGDPGAKNVRPDDKVVIEMVRFPGPRRSGEGVITKVLGDHAKPGVDSLLIQHEFDLPGDFPEDVLQAARDAADAFDESIGPDRRDLTDLTIITIDPVDARDFDDAISLRRLENGHWELGVHIADVSHFVPSKSPLDREARERATSIYLPDRVIPMLPEIISNNLASLQPDKVRYTKSVFIEFTGEGIPIGSEPCAAAIRSCRRFTYEEIDDYLAKPKRWKERLTPAVDQLVADMHELAMILRKRRMTRGALELNMPEIKLELDRDGRVTGASKTEYTESHQIIEEFMLSANEAVATLLRDREFDFLRRVHGNPDPRKLHQLTAFVRQLKIPVESMEDRFEIKRVLAAVEGQPEQAAVNYAVLRSMQKAVYSPEDEGHYALASPTYCHFTSPIRRYPDLTIHRLLDDLFCHRKPTLHYDALVSLGDHCSQREQRAEEAERELTKLKLLLYFQQRIGEQMDAVVTGVESFGMFVQGTEIPAEGLVAIETMDDDYYDYEPTSHSLVGRRGRGFRLGDVVRVAVAHVDMERRELDFQLVERDRKPPSKRRSEQTDARRSGTAKRGRENGNKREDWQPGTGAGKKRRSAKDGRARGASSDQRRASGKGRKKKRRR